LVRRSDVFSVFVSVLWTRSFSAMEVWLSKEEAGGGVMAWIRENPDLFVSPPLALSAARVAVGPAVKAANLCNRLI
jgi:hypothetical protein